MSRRAQLLLFVAVLLLGTVCIVGLLALEGVAK